MSSEADQLTLVGLEPDERLLGEDRLALPAAAGEPPAQPPLSAARRRIVGFGAAMTGGTLVMGSLLTVAALIETITSGFALSWVVVLAFAVLLVATHWGWVHVAELTATNIEGRRIASLEERRRQWLRELEPYPRWEVSTSVGDDGSITILTVRYRPVARGEGAFTFVREEVGRELHSAEEPAASVTERAEHLRRQAALVTADARARYEEARAAYDAARLAAGDEAERVAVLRAASQALSERINANLREPPLVE
jgi:hypothetical protein